MKPKVISDKTVIIKNRTLKLRVGKFIVKEFYVNDKLSSQEWSVEGGFKTTHPSAYNPQHMYFRYYENIDFLSSDKVFDYKDTITILDASSLVLDWNNFKGLDHVICDYTAIDGNIYKINKPEPIPRWRYQGYIGSFGNDHYDLEKVKKILESKKWIRNVKIIDVPYYNQTNKYNKAIEFEYKTPTSNAVNKLRMSMSKLYMDNE